MTDPAARVIRWFVCECGKKHAAAGVGPVSMCTCGRRLWLRMWEAGQS